MATLKTTVKTKLKTGMYIVYIRVLHNRQTSYVRTSWMVDSDGISHKSKEVTDPYVLQQASTLISRYYDMLNRVDISAWSASEVVTYLTKVMFVPKKIKNGFGIIANHLVGFDFQCLILTH